MVTISCSLRGNTNQLVRDIFLVNSMILHHSVTEPDKPMSFHVCWNDSFYIWHKYNSRGDDVSSPISGSTDKTAVYL